jgi:hypothetical protein
MNNEIKNVYGLEIQHVKSGIDGARTANGTFGGIPVTVICDNQKPLVNPI